MRTRAVSGLKDCCCEYPQRGDDDVLQTSLNAELEELKKSFFKEADLSRQLKSSNKFILSGLFTC